MSNKELVISIKEIENGYLVETKDQEWDYGSDNKPDEVTIFCKSQEEIMEAINDLFIVKFEME